MIDDDVNLLESIRRTADVSGWKLDTASSWEEGLSLFHVLAPNLVIADYHMPNSRHGLQLLHEIRRLRPSVRVILVSAYFNDDDVEKIMNLNVVDRALRKIDATKTMAELLEEIEAANGREDEETDWIEFAKARVRAWDSSSEALDELDQFLTTHRAP